MDQTELKRQAMGRLCSTRAHILNMTLRDFTAKYGISYGQAMDIEQMRSFPSQATRTLIEAVRLDPELVARAASAAEEIRPTSASQDNGGVGASDFIASPMPRFDDRIKAAAKGDIAALDVLFGEMVRILERAQCEPIEAITAAEIYSRLGAARGNRQSKIHLAVLLGRRADNDLSCGNRPAAAAAIAEGITIVSILAENGDEEMAQNLVNLVKNVNNVGISLAIQERPSILNAVGPLGHC